MHKIVILIFIFSAPILGLAKTDKQSPSKVAPAKTIKDFKGQFFYELTFNDDEPPTTTNCEPLGDSEIKKFSSYKCDRTDEFTKLFWDWSCSKESGSKASLAIVLGGQAQCEKSLKNFKDRN